MKKSVSPKKVKNRDVSGMTGQAIIKAILGGERDPQKLADFRDARVKASKEEIARSLEGHWQEDLLFVLRQEQNAYEFCQKQMAECDQRIEQYLQQREDRSAGASLPEEKRKERLRKKKREIRHSSIYARSCFAWPERT